MNRLTDLQRAARVISHEDAERARRHERGLRRLIAVLMSDDEPEAGDDGTAID